MPGIGAKLLAPNGYKNLSAEHTYHYLGRTGELANVLLCTFTPQKVCLEYITNTDFEHALPLGKIIPSPAPAILPVWLQPALDRAADPTDSFSMAEYKARNQNSVDKRHERIQALLKNPKEILESESPLLLLGRHARTVNAHEARLSRDFFLVVAYRTKWALLPQNFKKGAYKRKDTPDQKKRGPKHKARGSEYGWPITEDMRQKIYEGYERFSGPGRHLTEIWRKTLTTVFKCKPRRRPQPPSSVSAKTERPGECWEFFQPDGKPFPTYDQFRSTVRNHFGIDRLRRNKLGEQRTRTTKRPSTGRFTASTSNINERVFADGYYLSEVPKSFTSDAPMKPLCVIRTRDTTSGIPSGIGFSIGGETSEAYQMALFCMSIPKSLFGQLMGLKISDDEWPIVGLPAHFSVDGGPGSSKDLLQDLVAEVAFLDIAPSYAGQSKAVIESTNPKNTKASGAPKYTQSDLTYTRLAQREILRTVRDCQRFDVSDRLTPKMKQEGIQGNPLAIFNYLDANYRNDSLAIPFEDAVRSFLRPIDLTVTKNGARFHGQYFDSDDLRATQVLDRAAGSGNFGIKGYAIPLCIRQAWIVANGTLVEAHAQLPLRDSTEQLNISIHELAELEERQRQAARLAEESRNALDSEFEGRYNTLTGEEWDGGDQKSGRPKTGSAESRTEFADTQEVGTGGRR